MTILFDTLRSLRYSCPVQNGLRLYLPLWSGQLAGNTIRSVDNTPLTFTNTGSIKMPNGRVFDGDDYLAATIANFRSSDSRGAIGAAFKSSSTANVQTLFGALDAGSTTRGCYLRIQQTTGRLAVVQVNADTADIITGTTNVCDGNTHYAVLNSSGTAYSIVLDGVTETLQSPVSGSNTGDWFADTSSLDNVTSGCIINSGGAQLFVIGTIHEVAVWSRPLLVSECQRLTASAGRFK